MFLPSYNERKKGSEMFNVPLYAPEPCTIITCTVMLQFSESKAFYQTQLTHEDLKMFKRN